MTYIGEEFQKRYKTLPEDIQNALTAVASVDTIFAIGKKHGLMVDQIGKIADEIWKVMLGLANPKDFIRNLASALGIESEKASAIASDVNAQMFQPVRESLRRIYDQKSEMSSLRPREVGEAIPPSKDGIAEPVPSKARDLSPRNDSVPPMIYPQDPRLLDGRGFEEEFKKESDLEMFDTKGRTKEAPDLPAEALAKAGQIAPLVPSVVEGPPPSPPPPPKKEDFTYPEKTKEVSREPAAGQGGYKSRDPYRESVE